MPELSCPWMVFQDRGTEEIPVQVGVDFSGGDGFMSQHLLNGPEISSAFDKMSGEGVP